MATKTIAFYTQAPIEGEQYLLLEIGDNHVACSVTDAAKQPLAFEFYALKDDLNDWSDVFFEIKQHSAVLDRNFAAIQITYNVGEAILAPAEKLSIAAAEDYLALLFGPSARHIVKHDKLQVLPDTLTVYRIRKTVNEQSARHFPFYQVQHSYTQLVNQFLQETPKANLLDLQFYPAHVIATLIQPNGLQVIQSFSFRNAADACYHILNLLKQYGQDANEIAARISGFVLPHTELHRRIKQILRNRSFINLPEASLLPEMLQEYPAYYFTPFFRHLT